MHTRTSSEVSVSYARTLVLKLEFNRLSFPSLIQNQDRALTYSELKRIQLYQQIEFLSHHMLIWSIFGSYSPIFHSTKIGSLPETRLISIIMLTQFDIFWVCG